MKKKQYTPPVYIGQNLYIKPSYIVSLPEFHYENKSKSVRFEDNKINLRQNRHNGELSAKAINNIKNAINWMLVSTRKKTVYSHKQKRHFAFKVAFITLTLPDTAERIDNAKFQKLLLNPFLVYLRKFHGLKNYVWKMEFQDNGKLHCHITIDTFVHWRTIRRTWNNRLRACGLVDEFKLKYGHSDPNSTDIHSIKKVRNLAAYISKYMAKNPNKKKLDETTGENSVPKITGRLWSCNYELSRAKECRVHIPADQVGEEMRTLFNPNIEYKDLMRENPITKEPTKIGEIFYPKAIDWLKSITGMVRHAFDEMRREIQSAARHFNHYELSL